MLRQWLQDGIRHHQAGRYQEAEAAYQAAFKAAPDQIEPLRLLGILAHQRGRQDDAIKIFYEVCQRRPADGACRVDLGIALAAGGQLAAAAACFRQAVAMCPADSHCHTNLGQVLLRLAPNEDNATIAEQHFREAIRLEPGLADAYSGLGAALREQRRLDEAEAALLTARQLDPRSAKAANNLGNVLGDRGALEQAEAAYREAIALDPAMPEPHNNLGHLYRRLNRCAEAEQSLREALRLAPDLVDAMVNLGNVLVDLGQFTAAEASYRAALARAPENADAKYDLGALQLLTGRLAEGWAGYEVRWNRRGCKRRAMAAPAWRGDALAGRTLLLHAEQGFGDTIQFCRFIPELTKAGRVFVEAPPPLLRLLHTLEGRPTLIAAGQELPPHDLQLPLPSLPAVLGTTLTSIPASLPYLHADPVQIAAWRRRLANVPGLRVGVAWAGNADYALDSRRSIKSRAFAVLAALPGISLISLQKSPPEGAPTWLTYDWTDELHDFADTAALIKALDLVISVDTSIIHLAGALGRPAWLLNRFDSCWRWLHDRTDSPWYPGMRIFRQPSPLDWDSVLSEVAARLAELALAPAFGFATFGPLERGNAGASDDTAEGTSPRYNAA
jgi:Flp pilus assembly protein TadD